MANAKSRSSVDPIFSDRLKDIQTAARKLADALQNIGSGGWALSAVESLSDVDLSDPTAFADAFSRQGVEAQFDSATRDAESPGTTGDLIVIQKQGDLLASLERAFRARYMTSYARSMAHAAARADAAADQDGGVIRRAFLDPIEDLLKRSGQ